LLSWILVPIFEPGRKIKFILVRGDIFTKFYLNNLRISKDFFVMFFLYIITIFECNQNSKNVVVLSAFLTEQDLKESKIARMATFKT
jgi:hypothetical protein